MCFDLCNLYCAVLHTGYSAALTLEIRHLPSTSSNTFIEKNVLAIMWVGIHPVTVTVINAL